MRSGSTSNLPNDEANAQAREQQAKQEAVNRPTSASKHRRNNSTNTEEADEQKHESSAYMNHLSTGQQLHNHSFQPTLEASNCPAPHYASSGLTRLQENRSTLLAQTLQTQAPAPGLLTTTSSLGNASNAAFASQQLHLPQQQTPSRGLGLNTYASVGTLMTPNQQMQQ